jgi:tripartite ATP-independent transporter DctP family solute receptor
MKHLGAFAGSLLACTVLLFGVAQAEIKDRTLRFAFVNNVGHPQEQGAKKFADLVAERSGGKIKVALFPGGQLGGDLQVVSALQGGNVVDLTVLNAGLLAGIDKAFGLYDLPFLFDSGKVADAVVDGPVGTKLNRLIEDKGLHALGYFELGFRNVTNSAHPVKTVADLKGLRLRVVQAPIYIDLFTALGVNPQPMPFGEVYNALEQKVVDGEENPVSVIKSAKFFEVQKYLTFTRHTYNPQIVLISKKTWDGLDPEEQKLIQDALDEAKVFQRKVSRDSEAQGIADLTAAGMELTELAPEEVAKLRETVKPVIAKFTSEIDPAIVREFMAAVEAARKM